MKRLLASIASLAIVLTALGFASPAPVFGYTHEEIGCESTYDPTRYGVGADVDGGATQYVYGVKGELNGGTYNVCTTGQQSDSQSASYGFIALVGATARGDIGAIELGIINCHDINASTYSPCARSGTLGARFYYQIDTCNSDGTLNSQGPHDAGKVLSDYNQTFLIESDTDGNTRLYLDGNTYVTSVPTASISCWEHGSSSDALWACGAIDYGSVCGGSGDLSLQITAPEYRTAVGGAWSGDPWAYVEPSNCWWFLRCYSAYTGYTTSGFNQNIWTQR